MINSLSMNPKATTARSVLAKLGMAAGTGILLLACWAGPASATDEGAKDTSATQFDTSPSRPSYRDQLGSAGPLARTSQDAGDASVMPFQPYTDWSWPAGAHTSTSETLTIEGADPGSHYFWAYDFAIGSNGVGYTGLQTGAFPNNNKIALFAIWGADRAEGPACETFDGEGIGWTCRLDPFSWTAGHPYVLRVGVDGADAGGTWYKATIRDLTTGTLSTIGRIHHPTTAATIVGRGSWTEWFGSPSTSCANLKRSRVTWARPTAQDGRIETTGHYNHTESKDGSNDCADSAAVGDQGSNVSQAVGPK
ncbi:MAG: DUF3472 domain-containing protein [Acidimicrobiales bacterium]